MKPGKWRSATAHDAEVAGLVETLRNTGRRLEELTAGEVDSIVDADGRTLLLRGVQEQMRRAEDSRQGAILGALPAHVALLDGRGVIISVNEAWRQFGTENGLQLPGHALGTDYLAVCDSTRGEDAAVAAAAAAGIRSVLERRAAHFALEYPCHAPQERRWFLMTVTPLAPERPAGVVVMHMNISEHRLAREALRESERRFSEMLDNVALVSLMIDRAARITYCNSFLLTLTGWSAEELVGRNLFECLVPPDATDLPQLFADLLENRQESWHHENEILTRSGARRLIRWNNTVLKSADGEVVGVAGIGEDITVRKEAEQRIAHLTRVHSMASGINALIVHARDRDEMLRDACRIAVEAGGFRMSLISMRDADSDRIVPVASAGKDEELLGEIRAMLSTSVNWRATLVAQAMDAGQVIIINDSVADPRLVFAAKYAAAGVRSMVLLPLLIADKAVGVLVLYAGELGFFRDEEVALVTKLAAEIAFAIEHIDRRERLEFLAYYDPLTGLSNRRLFLERVAGFIRGASGAGHRAAVCLLDLERFKSINDTLGRPAGDALLKQVADWLTHRAGDADLLARVGADQFALAMPEVKPDTSLVLVIEQMQGALREHPFHLGEEDLRASARVGVAVYPRDGADADSLLKHAEVALKQAKVAGERFLFFDQAMAAAMAGNLTLENQLRQAVERGEFVLYYQPKVNLKSGKVTGAEALIRWNDPRTGIVAPGIFIPVLEETGLIHEVGRWALGHALEQYLQWRAAGLPAMRIAVNVSPVQLRSRGFVAEVGRALDAGINAGAGLELELTEGLIMADINHSIGMLAELRAMGVTIAIDDFGTGFSSLSYLSRLPVDTLKIDRSFVTAITTGPQGLALVSTIISLAHALDLGVVAEGVETGEQSRLLGLLGCDEMQGFLVSRPVPAAEYASRFLAPSGTA